MEESFVMLAGSASSLRQAPGHGTARAVPLQPLDSKFAQMARVFDIASGATKVWSPRLLAVQAAVACSGVIKNLAGAIWAIQRLLASFHA